MRIEKIFLRFFRNYENLELHLAGDQLFFLGKNAQGKTNLLEALYYLSTIRSFRASDDAELILFDQEFTKLEATFQKQEMTAEVSVTVSKDGKYIRCNRQPIAKLSDVIGYLNTVLFCPADLKSIYSSPKERRRFIDMELGKISSTYLHDLLQFQKLLKERNSYLKRQQYDDTLMQVLTEQMVDVQLRIMDARAFFLQLLEQHANTIYQTMSDEKKQLHIRYIPCFESETKQTRAQNLLERYQKTLEKDKELRATQIGIHREDFDLVLDDKELKLYGSQGQRRSAVLALKIGLLHVIHRKLNEYPVLLLDDVLSELDEDHRMQLFQVIPSGVQTLITATELSETERSRLSGAVYYHVFNGTITKEESCNGPKSGTYL